MIKPMEEKHPRRSHMRLVAAVNNVGMCAHLLKMMNQVMAESTAVLRQHWDEFVDLSSAGITIDEFINLGESMASELVTAEVYCPDVGATLAAIASKLPRLESANGVA